MITAVKRIVERTLVLTGAAAMARHRRAGQTLVLAYHGVRADDAPPAGDASLHLPRRAFARQLDALVRTHDVVPLADVLAPAPRDRPRAVVTFDDAYAGALEHGLEELARRALPATIFVAPGLLGRTTWWDRLADPRGGAIATDARDHALHALAGRSDAVLAWAAGQGILPDASPLPRIATEAELARAASRPGVTLGAHSWDHPNLAALRPAELAPELARPLAWLRERFPAATVPWLAYPYGLHSPSVVAAAAAAGYTGALRVDGGWVDGPALARPHALPRLNIAAGLSLDGFRLRLAGLLDG